MTKSLRCVEVDKRIACRSVGSLCAVLSFQVPILPPPPTAQEVKSQNLLEKKKKKVKAEKPPGPARPPSEPAVIQPTVSVSAVQPVSKRCT